MDLTDLKVFRTVVEAGGVARAASRLHRVPSNVTTRIRKLEEDLGVALFLREGKRLELSPKGKLLLGYAERLLALADEAREAMGDAAAHGTLRLGSMESTAAARLPALLSLLHEHHPQVSVELRTGTPRRLCPLVLSGELDAALVAEPADDERLASRVAFREELVLVSGAGQPAIASPGDVQNRSLLAFEPGCPHRERLERWFARSQVAPQRIIELGSYHAILGCAVAGMGVALMPRSVLDTYSESGRLSIHPLKGKFRHLRTLLVWRKAAPQAKVAALAALLGGEPRSAGRR